MHAHNWNKNNHLKITTHSFFEKFSSHGDRLLTNTHAIYPATHSHETYNCKSYK